jgi:acyl-CoA synthetase (AMP-forming)/AMP-acid ligase II
VRDPNVESIAHPEATISSMLADGARIFGDAPFLIDAAGGALTRPALDAEASRFARTLRGMGLPEGAVIGVFSPNSLEFVIAGYGILRSGYTFTPFNSSYKRRELLHQIRTSGASAVFVDRTLAAAIEECGNEIGDCALIPLERSFWADASPAPFGVDVDRERDVAFLPYSSGTAGMSKGVMLTQANLAAAVRQLLFSFTDPFAANSTYCFLPLYHIYGFNDVLNPALAGGGALHLRARFDMDDCLDTVERARIESLPAVPPILLAMLARPDLPKRDLSCVRWMSCGAAPLALATAHRIKEITGVRVRQGYGMTETAGIASANPLDRGWDTAASAGIPVMDCQIEIRDAVLGEQALPAGETGEVVMKGPNIMLGYYQQPEENARVLRDGWFYSGDIGRLDELGRLYLVDRKKEMIKYKGFQVLPAELESVILELEAVADCAVVGAPDEEAGEVPVAFVSVVRGFELTEAAIRDHVGKQVAGYKQVRRIEFIERIPRSPAGKILRRELIATFKA